MTLKFSDGAIIDTSGPMRPFKLKDGWYAVGEGMCIPCQSFIEAQIICKEDRQRRKELKGRA